MNRELRRLAKELSLANDEYERLRLTFGLACVNRVRQLLEDPKVANALAVCQAFVNGACDRSALAAAAAEVAEAARSHPGSKSIDGSGHAAVSASYAVANALAGRAIEAAEYAAYAIVYSYSVHAVTDPSSFDDEYAWQVAELRRLSYEVARDAPG